MNRKIIAILAVAVTLAVVHPRPADACCTSFLGICVLWPSPVAKLWVNTGAGGLTELTPARSAAEWERIVREAANIYRERGGTSIRFEVVGSGPASSAPSDAILITASDNCGPEIGLTHAQISGADPSEILWSTVWLRKRYLHNGTCTTINWNYFDTHNTYDPSYNPMVTLLHELGHSIGLAHPDQECGQPLTKKSYMMSNALTNYDARYFTRYDKEALAVFGRQDGTGRYYTLDTNWDTWTYRGAWPSYVERFTPGTPSRDSIHVWLSWGQDAGNTMRVANDVSDPLSWHDATWAGNITTWDPTALIQADNSGYMRQYFLMESSESSNDKPICYIESSDYGMTWSGTPVCPGPTTSRAGVTGAYDSYRKAYIVLYNGECDFATNCNRITALVQPGPGSTILTDRTWQIGHWSFNLPAVACKRGSTSVDRCIIAFQAAEMTPYLRWVQGGLNADGSWTTASDQADGSIVADHPVSVAYGAGDDRWHLAFMFFDKATNYYNIKTAEKSIATSGSWTNYRTYSFSRSAYGSISPPVIGTYHACFFGCADGMRMYLLDYTE